MEQRPIEQDQQNPDKIPLSYKLIWSLTIAHLAGTATAVIGIQTNTDKLTDAGALVAATSIGGLLYVI